MVNYRIVITWLETGQPRLLLQQKNNFFKYNRVSLYHGSIQHDIAYTIAMTDVEYKSFERVWNQRIHPLPRPYGQAMRYTLWWFGRQFAVTVAHCMCKSITLKHCKQLFPETKYVHHATHPMIRQNSNPKPTLLQIMAWRRTGDTPMCEAMTAPVDLSYYSQQISVIMILCIHMPSTTVLSDPNYRQVICDAL